MRELIIDLFAGGGGASEGIEQALGIPIDIAINHDPEAIRMHWLNHPRTRHITEDIWKVNPLKVIGNNPVGLLWASPDCTHHSRAKGGKPRSNKRRCLANVVIDWAKIGKPRVIILENVGEFSKWGPLNKKNMPIPEKRGLQFNGWCRKLKALGYKIEWKLLKACDYGVPTSRERLYLIARCDGQPIIWPEPTHGPGKIPYRTAAECINFSLPCPSIFLSKKEAKNYNAKRPLVENTLKRIAKGLEKFIFNCPNPFIVNDNLAFLTKYHGSRKGHTDARGQVCDDPLLVQDTQNRFGLVIAFLSKYYTGVVGSGLCNPLPTVTAIDHNALVETHLEKFSDANQGNKVRAFLIKYYGAGTGQDCNEPMHTVTTKDRMGLVVVKGQLFQIIDIGLRMLTPVELLKAHDFPSTYVLVGNRTNQVAKIGNSVCPPMAKALVSANVKIMEVKNAKVG